MNDNLVGNQQPLLLWFSWLANTRYAAVFRSFVFVLAIVVAVSHLLSQWDVNIPLGIQFAFAILVAVSPFAYREIALTFAQARAEINAALEKMTGLDLDNSGAVGDVPPVIEKTRLIPVYTSRRVQTVDGLPEGYTKEDFEEFVNGIQTHGLRRSAWLNPQYRFESGRLCNRAFHDAAMKILERMDAIEGRERGSDGYLKKSVEQIIAELG